MTAAPADPSRTAGGDHRVHPGGDRRLPGPDRAGDRGWLRHGVSTVAGPHVGAGRDAAAAALADAVGAMRSAPTW